MKKFYFMFLLALLPLVANADAVDIDGIYYYLYSTDGNNTALVTTNPSGKYSGDIAIPKSVTYEEITYSVTSIENRAFIDCSDLTSITIPNSVTSIGGNAFYGCSSLTSVTIPSSVTSIGEYAFSDCGLKEVRISDLEAWCKIKFRNGNSNPLSCAHLLYLNGNEIRDLIIPDGITKINSFAFYGASNILTVSIPNNVTSIGNDAFNGCSGLASVTIPNSVTTIGDEAFMGCTGLTSITIPNSVTYIGWYAFQDCNGLTSVTIPNSVTSIGGHAFMGCSGLISIIIPNSVTYIGYEAFSGCNSLTSVTIPNSVTSIDDHAFAYCSGLTSVTISESLTSIGRYAFYCCSGLTSITIPDGVTSIGEMAFAFCRGLTSVTIPNSVTSIEHGVFEGCSSLTSITIPESVTSFDKYAFSDCSSLTSITIPEGVTSIGENAFNNCGGLTSVTIPNGVTSIASFAFNGCSGLTSVTIPNSVTSIGGYAFSSCKGLSSVTIPNSVTSIDYGAFNNCSGLTDFCSLAADVPSTGYKVFGNIDIGRITLHVPAESIEKYAAVEPWKNFGSIVAYIPDDQLFPDCPAGEVRDAAIYLYRKGIVEGDKDGYLNADREATRAEVSKTSFYGAYLGPKNVPTELAVDNYPSVYSDLQDNTTYYYRPAKALLYLEYGDGVAPFDLNRLAFEPEEKIARVNVLKVLLETFNIKPDLEGTDNPFPNDANVVALANSNPVKMGYIRKAAALGIITTANDEFRPYDDCLRGEAFLMLARIMQKIEAGEIEDPKPQESDYFEPLNTTLKTVSLGASLQMGNFQHYTKTSFTLSGVMPLTFSHSYNSYNTTLPSVFFGDKSKTEEDDSYQPLGDGWSHNYHSFVTVVGEYSSGTEENGPRVIVHWGGGSINVYKSNGTKLVPESMGIYDEMEYAGGDELTIKSKTQIIYTFSKQGNSGAAVFYLSSVKDRNGNTLTINYEDGQDGSKRISSVTDGQRSLSFSYLSGTDYLSEVKDPLSRSIKFDYFDNSQTGKKQLKSFTDAEGNTTTYEYADLSKAGSSKLLSRIQLPKGNYIANEYDANMRLKKSESGVGGVPTTNTSVSVTANYGSSSVSTQSQVDVERGSQTSSYQYNFNENNVITSMTGDKNLFANSSYTNDAHPELPTAIQTTSTDVNDISYDEKGNVTSVTVSGDGTLTTTMTYDDMNNLTSVTDPKGNKTTYSYDGKGNLTGISAPEGVTASRTVDSKGLAVEISNAMDVITKYEYNEFGNLTKTTLPALGLSSSAVYDAASRLTSATDALGRTSSFVYNNNDFLTSKTDAMNHTTSFAYDKNNNLTSITNAKGGVTTMSYDNATDWLLSVEFAGAKKQYDYNKDGTLSSFTKPDGTTLSYSYDELGRVTNDGVNSYSYDDKLRLSEVSDGSKSISFTYDSFNRITATSYDGQVNNYSYDKNGNCTNVNNTEYSYDGLNRLTSVTFEGQTITYTYRKDSKLSKVDYPNGMATTYGYDKVGRLTSKQTTLGNGTVVAGYSYVLDKVGNITEQTTQEPYTVMALTDEETSYSYNDGNRITKAGDISFEFDANGNTTKRGDETYSWDKQDRLTATGATAIKYNPLGLIASYGDITFTTDLLGIGNVLSDSKSGAEYIYGNGLEARVVNGKTSYYVTDVRGSVVAIVDEDGNITHKYQYDEFGKVTQKEEADYNPFQYVGKYGVMALTDHQYYMRARHYDPTIGRFLSEDPIWSTNLYPYADNNPINGIDPRGEAKYGYMTDQWFHFDYYGEYDTYTDEITYYTKKDGEEVSPSDISQSVREEIETVTKAMAEADNYELVPKSNGRLVITKKGTGEDQDMYTKMYYSEIISPAARAVLVSNYCEKNNVDSVEIVKGFEYDRFMVLWLFPIDINVKNNPGAYALSNICAIGNPNCQ